MSARHFYRYSSVDLVPKSQLSYLEQMKHQKTEGDQFGEKMISCSRSTGTILDSTLNALRQCLDLTVVL